MDYLEKVTSPGHVTPKTFQRWSSRHLLSLHLRLLSAVVCFPLWSEVLFSRESNPLPKQTLGGGDCPRNRFPEIQLSCPALSSHMLDVNRAFLKIFRAETVNCEFLFFLFFYFLKEKKSARSLQMKKSRRVTLLYNIGVSRSIAWVGRQHSCPRCLVPGVGRAPTIHSFRARVINPL